MRRSRYLLRRPRSWLILLLAIWALGAPAGFYRQLTPDVSAIASFVAIFVAPGLILALTVLEPHEAGLLEYLAYAYSLSLGVFAVPAVALLALNLSFRTFSILFTLTVLVLTACHFLQSHDTSPEAQNPKSEIRNPKSLWLLLIAAALLLIPLATESTLDGDTFTYLAYIQEMQDTPNMNQTEALFGTGIEVSPRSRFNIWTTLPAYLVNVSAADTVTMAARYLPPMLVLLALAAFYTLALALTDRRDFALFATLIHILLVLAAPFHRETNPASMLLQRIVADKFMVLLLVLPVQTALTVRWLTDGRRRDLGLMALVVLAISFIHPLIATFYAIVVAAFGGLHLMAHLRDRAVWGRLGVVLVVALFTLGPPFLLRLQATATQGTYLFPRDFEGWPLVLRPTPVFPFVRIPSWNLRDAGPGIRDVHPEDATGENGVSPFLLWRFRTNMRARRLLLFSPSVYTSHPDLILEVPILLMLLLTPLLVLRLRQPAAQYMVGVTLVVLMMLYNPLLTPIVGRLITPWMLWRLTWLFPISLVLAYFAFAPVSWLQRLLQRAGRWFVWATPLVPAVIILGLAFVSGDYIRVHITTLGEHLREPAPDDIDVVQVLARTLEDTETTVLAKLDLNVLIPAYISRANVVAHRVNTTSEHFPDDRQVEALQRLIDVENFFAADSLLTSSLQVLQRYSVGYIIADTHSRLAAQLRHLTPYIEPLYQNQTHALFRVSAIPPADDIIAGHDALAQEQWATAQAVFERATAEQPENVLAWAGLGRALEGAGDPEGMARAYQRATALAPSDPWFHLRLARAYETLAQVDLAIREYEKVRALDPADTGVVLTLADLYRIQGDAARAEATYAAALSRLPSTDPTEYAAQVGSLWFERELFDRAAEAFSSGFRDPRSEIRIPRALLPGSDLVLAMSQSEIRNPKSEMALQASQAYQAAGQLDRALAIARQAVQRSPWTPVLYRQLGAVYASLGQTDAAIKAYRRALWLADLLMDPQVDPYVELGSLYAQMGDVTKAEQTYRRAAALDPYAAAPYIGLGSLFEATGRPDDALTAYRAAVDVEPSNLLGYINLGRLLLEQGQVEDALAQYEAAVRARPEEDIAHVLLGEAYRRVGRLDEATQSFRRAIALRPTNVLAHIGLMRTSIAQGRLQQARGQAQTAVRIAPGSARAHIALGDVHRILGETDAALAEYRAAVEYEPDYAGGHLALGQAYQVLGQLEDALDEYRRAAELESDSAQIYLALGDAYAALGAQRIPCGPGNESLTDCSEDLESALSLVGGSAVGNPRWDAALQAYQTAIRTDPQYVPSYAALTRLYLLLGQRDQALAQARATVNTNPRSPLAHLVLGETLLAVGQVKPAMEAYRAASQLAPRDLTVAIALGRAYQFLGQVPEALAQFRTAVERHPRATIGYLALGDALMSYGDASAALEAYDTAVRLEPGAIDGHLGRSRALLTLGRTDEALAAAEAGIQVRPGDMGGYLAKGTVLERVGRFDEARTQYERAAELNRASPAPHTALGDLWLAQGQTEEALAAYRAAVEAAPGDPTGWLALADALRSAGQLDEAIFTYQTAAELNKSLPDAWVSLGELYADNGQPEEAEAAFQRALERVPGDPRALLGLARLYEARGQPALALTQLQAAVEARPGSVQAHVALGDLLLRRGQTAEAIEAYQQALRVAPGDRGAGLALVRLYMVRGDWPTAIAILDQVIAAAPGDVAPYLALSALQRQRGDIQAARMTLRRAVQANPASAAALVAQAALEASLGRLETAIAGYEQALDLDPMDVTAYEGLATTYAELGQYEDAVRVARTLLWLRPADAISFVVLGRVLQAKGDTNGAQQAFEQAIALDPASADALNARLRLAQLIESRGDYERAEGLYRAAVENAPAAPAAHLALGRFLQARGRLEEAAAAFVRAAELDRSQAAPWVALGDLRTSQGELAAAWAAYEMAKRSEPGNPIAYLRLSRLYLDQDDAEHALAELEAARARRPGAAITWVALGDYYRAEEQTDSAAQAYREALWLSPDLELAWLGLGYVYRSQEQYDTAIAAFERALNVDDRNVSAYLGVAQSYEATGNTRDAASWYARALEIAPTMVEAYLTLGDLLKSQNEYTLAEGAYRQALEVDSSAFGAYLGLAQLYLDQGDADKAKEAFEQALIASNGRAGHAGLMRILHQQEGEEDALARYQALAEENPNQAWVQMALAKTHDALEQIDEAIAAYRRVIALDPGNADAFQRLAQLLEGRMDGRMQAVAAWEKFAELASNPDALAEAEERLRTLRQVWITSPQAGSQVKGVVELKGNALDDNFKSFRIQVGAGDAPAEWTVIRSEMAPVQDDLLARWDTRSLMPGVYQVRLVVTNSEDKELPYAQISVLVER